MNPLLYNIDLQKDACGTGFVTHVNGAKSHEILQLSLEALTNLSHRGGASADGQSGDGAGVLTQIPRKLFQRYLHEECGTAAEQDFAVGMVFLPSETALSDACIKIMETCFRAQQLPVLGWREVPVDRAVLGQKAAEECPNIRQVFVSRPAGLSGELAFERKLFVVRKAIEREVHNAGLSSFYVPSLSHRTIVYKGLFIAPQLRQFYLDLQDPDYETALAVFHQRYSTNTFPKWHLAQPFRMLAHNGEINTIRGNENWMRAWESSLDATLWQRDLANIRPLLTAGGSDSAKLDNFAEFLSLSGRHILHTLMMLIPEAYEHVPGFDEDLRAFYEYHEAIAEPWDGPAAVVFSDGGVVGATLDRNGLRPARYTLTGDGLLILASEVGVVDLPSGNVLEKGRLGPGKMIAVDVEQGLLLKDQEIKHRFSKNKPYRSWLAAHKRIVPNWAFESPLDYPVADTDRLNQLQTAFGYSKEDIQRILHPMTMFSTNPLGSMGDDTPLSVFSQQPRMLYTYFKQKFAQVTNPPIDPIREKMVMSLRMMVGHRGNILEEVESHARFIDFPGPILSKNQFDWLQHVDDGFFKCRTLSVLFDVRHGKDGLPSALAQILEQATQAVDSGCAILILSDRGVNAEKAPIPMLLAVSAVHHHLIRNGRRMRTSLVCETGEVRDEHHLACLIGYGASCVYPYLAYQSIAGLVDSKKFQDIEVDNAITNYKKSLESGVLKIMAKMGISTINSYRGAQIFEAIGLEKELIDRYFTGTESRIGGADLPAIAEDVLRLHQTAFPENPALPDYGFFRFRKQGEVHGFSPDIIRSLHQTVQDHQNQAAYRIFSQVVHNRIPINLRDLLDLQSDRSTVPIEQVEPIESIVRRFCTTAMSLGALSHEAHLALAVAMNRLGAKSNSGEGGEDPSRFYSLDEEGVFDNDIFPMLPGDSMNSAIKQVASGRFGVTPAYLGAARELEIKMAQGAKPGEGGQLPGHKVTKEIARIRYATPGTTLISPPPHHDIYSIEDLAQLIYDLKCANPRAKVSVKLVAEAGVGTIAAGVAKGYADGIHISGHDGGTGASPLSSIKNTGISWELGLAETQHVLVSNNLRGRVYLRVDGGLKTGRDVMIAALLGAEEFGFGTAALVAIGCVMARQCHLNTCPVGVATQRNDLRAKFRGQPEHAINYIFYVAQEVRELLAGLGYQALKQVIGRTDLLTIRDGVDFGKAPHIDLNAVLHDPDPTHLRPRRKVQENNLPTEQCLDEELLPQILQGLQQGQNVSLASPIRNGDRTVGARIAGELVRRYGTQPLSPDRIELHFSGSAGQSFGAFCTDGMRLILQGEANDYVGKGMGGGEIVIFPHRDAPFDGHRNVIMGNTVMYGATGGTLYAAGRAGERFCVRNSGGTAVVEGVGDHGCEYMTGGAVVILGPTGRNFGAGMTGGLAYVLDERGDFESGCNGESVAVEPLDDPQDSATLRRLIQSFVEGTDSLHGRAILENWDEFVGLFKIVRPQPPTSVVERKRTGEVEVSSDGGEGAEEALR